MKGLLWEFHEAHTALGSEGRLVTDFQAVGHSRTHDDKVSR